MSKLNFQWRKATLAAVLGGASLISTAAYAATPEPPGLFSTLRGHAGAQLPEQAIAAKSHAVEIHKERLANGRLFLKLPGNITLEAVRDLQHEMGPGKRAWVGHASGDRDSRVILGVSGNAVAGTIAYKGKLYKLEPRANGTHILSEVALGDPAPELDPIPVASDATAGDAAATLAADGSPAIDVMVAYTPRIQSIYGTQGAEALSIQAVAETNQAYANSGISQRLNLVHTVLTSYSESGNMSTDLNRLRSTSDGYMDELHTLRNEYGADLVSLIEDEPQYCGIAYRMTSNSSGFAASAFSVVHRGCATGYYSFAHELGHNQGAHHDPANASGAIYAYAYGHQDPYGSFRTVMAYNCSGGCSRVDHFSNPNVLYSGKPTGALNASDNARTLNNTAATVAGFRAGSDGSIATPPAAPSQLLAAATGTDSINLGWRDNADDESGFRLERSADGISFSPVASLPTGTTDYQDNGLNADTFYHYRLHAWNSAGDSPYTDIALAATESVEAAGASATAIAEIPVAGIVTNDYEYTWSEDRNVEAITEVKSDDARGSRYAYLEHKWTFEVAAADQLTLLATAATSASASEESFTFAYSTDNSDYIDMFSVTSSSPARQQFTLPSGIEGTLYVRVRDSIRVAGATNTYKVRIDQLIIAAEGGGEPGTPPVATVPAAPDSLSATANGTNTIIVSWADRADNETGYTVERRLDGSSQWNAVTSAAANSREYTDTGLSAATRYHYRASAFNDAGQSSASNSDAATTEAIATPPPASELELLANGYKVKGKHRIQLSWSGAGSAKVDIYRDGARITTTANSGSYTDSLNRKGGGSYQYQVCEAGISTCSQVALVSF